MTPDGARLYRYDAMGRLVQVRELGGVLPDAFDEHTGKAVGGVVGGRGVSTGLAGW